MRGWEWLSGKWRVGRDKEWEMAKFIHFFVHCTDRDRGPGTVLSRCVGMETYSAGLGLTEL